MKKIISVAILLLFVVVLHAEDGHNLWFSNQGARPVNIVCSKQSPLLEIAKKELAENWCGSVDTKVELLIKKSKKIKNDGYIIREDRIQANTELGILYGVYDLLRRQKCHVNINEELCNPSYQNRILNHWDNLDGSVERGYAGKSIFWRKDDLRVTDNDKILWEEYARANASIGINGVVLNNVNAAPQVLSDETLQRVASIANVLRTYGIRTYLSINFASPNVIGALATSDPLDKDVIQWWTSKAKEIYKLIPDFGGFLVKANSEGQPGPQDFGRTHVDGANMLADILKPYNSIVMWRAFVYNSGESDRAKQAYAEFIDFDGKFRDNVIVQVKNGPIDFQPREPFSPLFGAMKHTSVMPELQITQEYLGHSVHLVYLAPMWEEFLQSDTYQDGKGSTVARCTDGSIYPSNISTIAGVANIGLDKNWSGHDFAQSNWYAFGRLAWDNSLSSSQIADEWIRLSIPNNQEKTSEMEYSLNLLNPVKKMMLESREAAVNYMMPLGFHHIFQAHHHYGPAPWWELPGVRKDWTCPYYHKADDFGVGFNRTSTGTNAVGQYQKKVADKFNVLETCPEEFILWFHHVSWDHTMKSGNTLWEEICYRYDMGVTQVRGFQTAWDGVKPYVDADLFNRVQIKLRYQSQNAQVWKDACLLYFQEFSKREIPLTIERPIYILDELKKNDSTKP